MHLVAAIDGMDRDEVLMLLGIVPERVGDLVSGLDEPRLAYRHAPAFPTLKEVIGHLSDAGTAVDGLLRRAYLDDQRELPVRASIDPTHAPENRLRVSDTSSGTSTRASAGIGTSSTSMSAATAKGAPIEATMKKQKMPIRDMGARF